MASLISRLAKPSLYLAPRLNHHLASRATQKLFDQPQPIRLLSSIITQSHDQKSTPAHHLQDRQWSSQRYMNQAAAAAATTAENSSNQSDKMESSAPLRSIKSLEQIFDRFEERCQRTDRVLEKDFVKTFDFMTKTVEKLQQHNLLTDDALVSISIISGALLRCCGNLMTDSPNKHRELLAGNLWQYMKEKNIPLDISHYNSLLRILNENEANYDPKKLMEEIEATNLTPDRITYQRLIHQYCLQGDVDGATNLLEKMKELNLELTETIFSSLIVGYGKQDNPPSIAEMFELMRSNGVEPGPKSISAALHVICEQLGKNAKADEDLNVVNQLIVDQEIQFGPNEIVDIFIRLAPHKSHEVISKVLEYIREPVRRNFTLRNKVITGLIKTKQFEMASEIYWLVAPSDRAIEGGSVGISYITALSSLPDVPIDFIVKECKTLQKKSYNSKPFHRVYYVAAENGRLDLVREAIKNIASEEPIKCQYIWPLIAQAKSQEEILEVLKNDLNPKMNSTDLIETFSEWIWPRFADSTKKLLEATKDLGYDQNMVITSFFNYSVNENKIDEAIKVITESPEGSFDKPMFTSGQEEGSDNESDPRITPRQRIGASKSTLLGRLLEQVAEHTKDPKMVNKVFEMCKIPSQMSGKNLTPLVKVHMLNKDFKSALETFLKLAEEHQVIAYEGPLISHCLVNKDPDNLQKIMNVLTNLTGEGNALFELAVSCLENGKLKQAQKILSSPGFRVRPPKVYYMCNRFARMGDLTILENYVNSVRNMYDVDQEYLYRVLLSAYDRANNGKRALNLWNVMQEEDFQPSKKTMLMIAQVLEKNNIAVPFQKPRVSLKEANIYDR